MKKFKSWSFKTKIVLITGALFLFSVSFLSLLLFYSSRKMMTDLLNQKISTVGENADTTFGKLIEANLKLKAFDTADLIATFNRHFSDEMNSEERQAMLGEIIMDEGFHSIYGNGYIFVADENGIIIYSPVAAHIGQDISGTEFYQSVVNDGNYLIDFEFENDRGKITVRRGAGVVETNSGWSVFSSYAKVKAYLVLQNDNEDLVNDLSAEGVGMYFFDTNGIVQTHPNPLAVGWNIEDLLHVDEFSLSDLEDQGMMYYDLPAELADGEEGVRKMVAYRWSENLQLYIAVGSEQELFMLPLKDLAMKIWLIAFVTLVSSLVVMYIFVNFILKAMNEVLHKLQDISNLNRKADLSERLSIHTEDEIGKIAHGVNDLMGKLNHDMLNVKNTGVQLNTSSLRLEQIITEDVNQNIKLISENADHVLQSVEESTASTEQANATIEEIVRSITSVNSNIDRQVAAVEESASAMEEMSRNIESVAVTANETKDISLSLNEIADEGGLAVKEASESVRQVSEYSIQIMEMLKLITGIANQTNLLAMNASIEAAHAGEAGKGFAIVADEIRRLSETTNKNAGEIEDVVKNIIERIESSVRLSDKAGEALTRIVNASNLATDKISALNTTMEEQNYTAKEILNSIQEIVHITEEIKFSMEEQSRGIDEFGNMISSLRDGAQLNKSSMQSHMQSLDQLIHSINDVHDISRETRSLSEDLDELLNRFILDENVKHSDETGLKLID